jgi:surfeit locus 1 family protein
MRAEARALLWQAVFTAAMAALLLGLGAWQLRRLAWKEALIARVESRARAAPVAPPPRAGWPALKPADYDFLHVRAAGRFDFSREALIFARPPQGATSPEPGYDVLTPFRLDDGGVILVDRGFIPLSRRRSEARRREPVEIVGVLRAPQGRNLFTPADTPESGVWYTSDARAIAGFLKIDDAAPFTLELDPAPGEATPDPPRPHGGEVELVNNHLSYAITWFSLAAAVTGGFAFYAIGRLRGR